MNKTVSQRIKKLRRAKGLNQKEFGDLIGVSNAVISNWERGENNPSVEALQKICSVLGVSSSELLDETPTEYEPENIGSRLQQFRIEKNLTQEQLGRMVDVTPQAISSWENDVNNIDIKKIAKVCKALEISTDQLFGLKSPETGLPLNELVLPDPENISRRFYDLDEYGKEAVRSILDVEQKRMENAKKEERVTIYPIYEANQDEQPIKLQQIDYYYEAAGMGTGQYVEGSGVEKLELPKNSIPDKADFLILVVGDSMEPTFYSGDKLFVQKTYELRPGDIGVFNLNGEELVKEFGIGELISHNKKYEPIRDLEGCYIQGKVIGKYEES